MGFILITFLFSVALAELQKIRPSLVQDVIDEYCQARRTYLTRAFLDALTVGGPGGTPRPIGKKHAFKK